MRNKLLDVWTENKAAFNGWLAIGDPFVAEIIADAGFDSVTIDVQHGFLDYSDARAMMQAMRASGVTILARAPWREPGVIMKLLDGGCEGIICPMINTAQEAEDLVSMMKYPPDGTRSYGPVRAKFAAGGAYDQTVNDDVLAFAMIETAEGFANLDAICATKGLSGVYIGPGDLTLGLTNGALRVGLDREEPEMIDAIRHICDVAHGAGLKAGIHCGSTAYAKKAVDWGFDLVTIATDVSLLVDGAKSTLKAMK